MAAVERVRSGDLGRVVAIDLAWNVDDPATWRREEEVAALHEADTDWKRFLLHLPEERFDPRKHLEFPLFWPYSSGIPDQWLSALIHMIPHVTGDPVPRSCVATGAIRFLKDGRRNPDAFTAVFDYPRGFQVVFESRLRGALPDIRESYATERATVDLRTGTVGLPGARPEEDHEPDAPARPRIEEFLECVRTRRTPASDIESGFAHSVAICMAIEAFHAGKRIGYDAIKEKLIVF